MIYHVYFNYVVGAETRNIKYVNMLNLYVLGTNLFLFETEN